jgi:hypothetical protein
MQTYESLKPTTRECKYYLVFTPNIGGSGGGKWVGICENALIVETLKFFQRTEH